MFSDSSSNKRIETIKKTGFKSNEELKWISFWIVSLIVWIKQKDCSSKWASNSLINSFHIEHNSRDNDAEADIIFMKLHHLIVARKWMSSSFKKYSNKQPLRWSYSKLMPHVLSISDKSSLFILIAADCARQERINARSLIWFFVFVVVVKFFTSVRQE